MTLSDLERRDARGQLFQADLQHSYRLNDQIRQGNVWGGVNFKRVSHATTVRGGTLIALQFGGFLLYTCMRAPFDAEGAGLTC